ncbi:hypothetical protein [Acanthopleuribacter pedis]|uniref:Uncharacterized protein n=1 Tax=Acanthopleuribacter pedis TaxID=442870 RepID=A0A8J7QDK6_9BACT|nr:hypothetical protein [Acanthopleuribacter pedis]MBO1319121.1 hypothetical protein [Acanthopleuribacter pedis]
MKRTYQCGACAMSMSDPVDQCPICGDHFFWRVVPRDESLDEARRRAFVALMQSLMQNPIPESFLTHGGHCWLPDTYWQFDPEGKHLRRLDWVVDLDLHQHNPAPAEPAESTRPVETAGERSAKTVVMPVESDDSADASLILFEENEGLPRTVPVIVEEPDLADTAFDPNEASVYLVDEDDAPDWEEAPTPAWDQPTASVTPTVPEPLESNDPFHSMPMIVDEETGVGSRATSAQPELPEVPLFGSTPMVGDVARGESRRESAETASPLAAARTAPMIVEGDNQFTETVAPASPPPAAPRRDASLENLLAGAADPASAPPKQAPSRARLTAAAEVPKGPVAFSERPFFKPVMVFLLTMFLSFSYLTLCYYRNQRTPGPPPITTQGDADAVLP